MQCDLCGGTKEHTAGCANRGVPLRKPWTVADLKEKLRTMDDNCIVQVGVRVYTQAHAVDYLQPFSMDRAGTGCTLWVSFPKGTVVSKRRSRI